MSSQKRKWRIRDEMIYDTIMEMVLTDPQKMVRPEDIAIAVRRDNWQDLLKRIRLFAGKLGEAGYVDVMRKGAVADPTNFKGVYRLRAGQHSAEYRPKMPADLD